MLKGFKNKKHHQAGVSSWHFVKEKAGPFALALGLTFTMASCTPNELPSETPSSMVESSDSTESSSESSSETTKPIKYEYSEILKTVLSDDYYNNLIATNEKSEANGTSIAKRSQAYKSVPYGFLEDNGYDIEKLKNDELFCQSDVYVIGNDLYIEIRAEKESSVDYCGNYLLKYKLTDKELNELDVLFSSLSPHTKVTYYQAPFFIQELSYQKQPEVLSEAYITEAALDLAEVNIGKRNYMTKNVSALYMGSTFNEEEYISKNTFQIHKSTTQSYGNQPKTTIEVAQITFTSYGRSTDTINGKSFYDNEIYDISSGLLDDDKKLFEESKTVVTSYSSHNASYEDILEVSEFENMFEK